MAIQSRLIQTDLGMSDVQLAKSEYRPMNYQFDFLIFLLCYSYVTCYQWAQLGKGIWDLFWLFLQLPLNLLLFQVRKESLVLEWMFYCLESLPHRTPQGRALEKVSKWGWTRHLLRTALSTCVGAKRNYHGQAANSLWGKVRGHSEHCQVHCQVHLFPVSLRVPAVARSEASWPSPWMSLRCHWVVWPYVGNARDRSCWSGLCSHFRINVSPAFKACLWVMCLVPGKHSLARWTLIPVRSEREGSFSSFEDSAPLSEKCMI